MPDRLLTARIVALLVPAALVAGAWAFQLLSGLYPCEMCHWQRWPHYAALVVGILGWALPPLRQWRWPITLAALLILASGAIGVLHAGVEYGWWEGPTQCSAMTSGGSEGDVLEQIMSTPLVRCDVPQWTFQGISLAGFNAIISILAGLGVLGLLASRPR